MEILCSIIAILFSILAAVFGVKRRVNNTRLNTNRGICSDRTGLDNALHDYQQLERDQERVQELERRSADDIRECARISERIRKREPTVSTTE